MHYEHHLEEIPANEKLLLDKRHGLCMSKGMTVKEFNTVGYREKTEAALKGTFLIARLTHRHYIKLYNVEHFYVEVFFDDRNHLITHFKAFDQTSLVLPYLEDLQVAV